MILSCIDKICKLWFRAPKLRTASVELRISRLSLRYRSLILVPSKAFRSMCTKLFADKSSVWRCSQPYSDPLLILEILFICKFKLTRSGGRFSGRSHKFRFEQSTTVFLFAVVEQTQRLQIIGLNSSAKHFERSNYTIWMKRMMEMIMFGIPFSSYKFLQP